MTTTNALVLAVVILAALGMDFYMDWGASMFLARKFLDFVGYVMFWR